MADYSALLLRRVARQLRASAFRSPNTRCVLAVAQFPRPIALDCQPMTCINCAGMGLLLLLRHRLPTRDALIMLNCQGDVLDAASSLGLRLA